MYARNIKFTTTSKNQEIFCGIRVKIRAQINGNRHPDWSFSRHPVQKFLINTPHKNSHKIVIQRGAIVMCHLLQLCNRHSAVHHTKFPCRKPVFMDQICFFPDKTAGSASLIVADKTVLPAQGCIHTQIVPGLLCQLRMYQS